MADKLNIGVLISGRGSNLKALINACKEKNFPAQIVLIISNKKNAPGLKFAEEEKIPFTVIENKKFADRESFDRAMTESLVNSRVELVCLAGFMRLLTKEFTEKWHDKLINIHPSLLPSFKGMDVHKDVLKSGVKLAGCTVHYVRPEMDSGPIIAQAAVPVFSDDTEELLSARVLAAEHKIYPLAVKLIAERKVKIVGERVIVEERNKDNLSLINPS